MSFQQIPVPDEIRQLATPADHGRLIDTANDAIEAFMLEDELVIENFVTCDFHLVDQSLQWISQNHLCTGNRFCEFGAGFGVVAMLASLHGYDAIAIEIERRLVDQANRLKELVSSDAEIYLGSFVPRGIPSLSDVAAEVSNVDTSEDDVWEEAGLEVADVDLFFSFPWPGEHGFVETILEAQASVGSLLLTYRGRDGMQLLRKV